MTSSSRWHKIQRACEWPIACLAFGSAVVLLAYRMGALPGFAPLGTWIAACLGLIAVLGTLVFVGLGIFSLSGVRDRQGDAGQRANSPPKAGLRLKSRHSMCRACVGRGYSWTSAPGIRSMKTSTQASRSTLQDMPTQLKVECPACGGNGFTDA